ncbi:MAG: DoxX family protein [Chloroflexota bacterium]|nr:MAG: DoxX family protein [Chloroflexota bacterium]
MTTRGGHIISDPPIARWLFSNTEVSWIWLILRVYLGWQWIDASLHKLSDPRWMENGTALQGFWIRAAGLAEGSKPLIVFDWYRAFIQFLVEGGHYVWFAKLVAVGEFAIGIALVLGAFVGFAALFGALMNWNFMMAGTASTNPLLFVIAILLLMAWKTAGYWGADRFLLRVLGTPWSNASKEEPARAAAPAPQVQPAR